MTPVLLDTGFLVALFSPADTLAKAAADYVKKHRHPLATVSAAVVEACFFFSHGKRSSFSPGCAAAEHRSWRFRSAHMRNSS